MADFGGFSSEFGPGTAPPIPPPPPQDLTMVPTPIGVFNNNGAASYYTYAKANNGGPVTGGFGIGQLAANGWDGTAYGYGASMYFRAVGAWTLTSHGTEILFYTCPSGATAAVAEAGVSAGGALWCGGPGVLPTNATDGFFGTPTMAGAPTSNPVVNYQTAPMVFDTTNNLLRIYDAGWFALATQGQPASFTTLTLTTPLGVANGGTGVTTSTGTGANVLGTAPALSAPTVTGGLAVTGLTSLGNGASAALTATTTGTTNFAGPAITIDGVAGTNRMLGFTTAGALRWGWQANTGAESGGDAGSNLNLVKFSDAGVASNLVTINRSNGLWVFNAGSGPALNIGNAHGVLLSEGNGAAIVATAPGTAGQTLTSQGAAADPTFTTAAAGNILASGPNNPAAPPSNVASMAGLGALFTFTPTRNGRVMLTVSGHANIPAAAAAGAGILLTLYYGTGTAPANGAAVTGTALSSSIRAQTGVAVTSADFRPMTVCGVATGLAVGTTYWVDVSQTLALTGSPVTFANITFIFMEQ